MNDTDFLATVNQDLLEIENSGVKGDGDQFAIWFCSKILGETLDDARDIYHIGGPGDHKIDIGIADEDHETVIVAQCKFSHDPLNETFNADLPASAKDAVDRLKSLPDKGNAKRREFAKAYSEIDEDDKPKRCLAVGFGRFSEQAKAYVQANNIEMFDLDRLKELYEVRNQPSEGEPPSQITFLVDISKDTIIRKLTFPPVRELITVVKAGDIYDAVRESKHKLFEQNLRYKLSQSSRTLIAGAIKKTLQNQPDELLLLNNGLTIICGAIRELPGKLILVDPQIVNGCQTSWAIYEALTALNRDERDSRRNAEILVKIVESSDVNLSSRIARSSNQQNAIAQRDLKANDQNQKEIAYAFEQNNPRIFFERKDGQIGALNKVTKAALQVKVPNGRPPTRSIDNMLAGQLYLAVIGLPFFSKQSKKQIFAEFYNAVFGININDPVDRYKGVVADPKDLILNGNSAANFRDDVIFGFSVFELGEAVAALYQDKLNLYDVAGASHSALQLGARTRLIDSFGYIKFWQYLLVAACSKICHLWAYKRKTSDVKVRQALTGSNIDIFFQNGKLLKAEFKIESDLDYALILDEKNPSVTFATFASWYISLSSEMTRIVEQYRASKPTSFRWNALVDQRVETYKALEKWIEAIYNKGSASWEASFPLVP